MEIMGQTEESRNGLGWKNINKGLTKVEWVYILAMREAWQNSTTI